MYVLYDVRVYQQIILYSFLLRLGSLLQIMSCYIQLQSCLLLWC